MLSETLAAFVARTHFDDLPQEAIKRAKSSILDCLGVMLAGSTQEVGRLIIGFAKSFGGDPRSSVVSGGFRTSPVQAALVNGTLGHALDYDDDSDTTIAHPTVTMLPGVLALGEDHGSGRDVLEAYILGVEVAARIGSALLPHHYHKGWHATSTLGAIGSTAASAKILKLDVNQTKNAFGIAASEASGLRSNFGTMVKPLHAGSAASKGVTAALLAQSGFTANQDIFEGPQGFIRLFGGKNDARLKRVADGLGKFFDIVSPGINIKKYPCCYQTHSAIDALLYLVKKNGLIPEGIRAIRCGVHEITPKTLIHPDPVTGLEAKFSLPYCLAVALATGYVRMKDFQDDSVLRPDIRKHMGKVEMYVHPKLRGHAMLTAAMVDIETQDGRKLSHRVDKPSGSGRFPLSWEALVSKFTDCASLVLGAGDSGSVVEAISALDTLSSIKPLMETLSMGSLRKTGG
jgi:2-methylcitrate dehydratase PrpD